MNKFIETLQVIDNFHAVKAILEYRKNMKTLLFLLLVIIILKWKYDRVYLIRKLSKIEADFLNKILAMTIINNHLRHIMEKYTFLNKYKNTKYTGENWTRCRYDKWRKILKISEWHK